MCQTSVIAQWASTIALIGFMENKNTGNGFNFKQFLKLNYLVAQWGLGMRLQNTIAEPTWMSGFTVTQR